MARPKGVVTPPVLVGPTGGVRWRASAQILLLPPEPDQVHFEKNPVLIQDPISIYKFGQPFSNSFGGIAPWYVTPPLIQFVFELMLCIWRKLLLLVPLFMHEKSMVLSFLS